MKKRSLFSILTLGILLSGYLSLFGEEIEQTPPSPVEFTFDPYEIVIGSTKRQTVLTGFLLGGAIAEIVVVNTDENDNRHLRIYTFGDGTWTLKFNATLRPEVLFVDVANISGRDRLMTYGYDRLNWFDPESATEHLLCRLLPTSYHLVKTKFRM